MIAEEQLISDYAKRRFSSMLSTTWLLTASLSIKTLEEEKVINDTNISQIRETNYNKFIK